MKSVAITVVVVLVLGAAAAAAAPSSDLPPETLRGLAHRLDQYPTPSLATPAQRAAAHELLADLRAASLSWRDPRRAARRGFAIRRPLRKLDDRRVMWFHAEHRRWSNDDVRFDPRRPEVIIYADAPGRPLVLVGVMFSMPRGTRGASPGGPITRWHWHRVCARGDERGLSPSADGSCPPGTKIRNGSEMMHIWFTDDLRSAFAIHAPVPELCGARKIPLERCATTHAHG